MATASTARTGHHLGRALGRPVVALALLVTVAMAGCTAAPTAARPDSPAAPPGAGAPAPAPAGGTDRPLPADLLLPDEGEPGSDPDFTDWTTDPAVDRAWLLDPCVPTAYPTDRQRASFRTVSQTGPEAFDARQLAVYPSPDVATEVMAGFRRALTACSNGVTAEGSRWQWVTQDARLGDDGLVAASTSGGGEFSPAGDRIAVTRVGSAVFLAYGSGEFATAEIDAATKQVQAVALEFLGSL